MTYDYLNGKKRITEILDNKLEVIEQENIPSDQSFTFDNAYFSWVTGIFVDIRNSTSLFANQDKVIISKIIRCFTSEIIDILRASECLREIGIRGDCVYAIYSTPKQEDLFQIMNFSFDINTYLNMLEKLLAKRHYPNISAGIGIATAQELIVKAGRKNSGINNKVWIGEAVTKAAKLSSIGNKKDVSSIVVSEITYNNMIESLVKSSGEQARTWFNRKVDPDYNVYYHGSLLNSGFSKWIDSGMQ